MLRAAVAVAAAALAGCGPKEINYQVQIVTQACESSVNPFQGVQFLRVYVRGEGIDLPLDVISGADPATRQVSIPEIPPGPRRIVEVRAYDGDPLSGGRVVSMGKSVPFDVPNVVPDDLMGGSIPVVVFLRKVNAFTPVSSAAAPTQCQRMKVARAGHTATELKGGKVFIAGGFNYKAGSPERQALADTEVYNPTTGAFEPTKDISITASGSLTRLPVAFHTATRLTSGQVLLWGGEVYVGMNNTVSPKTQILVYDGDVDDFGAFPSRASPAAIPRSRHRAAIDQNGKVLIVGGQTRVSSLVPAVEVEWFDPEATSNQYKVVDGVSLPRLDAAVAAVKGGEFIAVAGGTDGMTMKNDVAFFKYNGSTFAQQSLANPPRLADPGRRAAGVATVRDGADMIVLGGHSDPTLVNPVASSEVISSQSATVSMGPAVNSRGDICAVTMTDGTVIAVGGRTALMPGMAGSSDGTSVLIKSSAQGGVTSLGGPDLSVPRYAHTCTALQDGTVLVTGGINESMTGAQEILQDAYIYQPAPVD